MSDEYNKKKIKISMRVVAFSDLTKLQEISYKQIGVGNMSVRKERIVQKTPPTHEVQEQLEREGNESIF